MNNKILINASPRSGHTWLQFILYNYKIKLLKNIEFGGNINTDAFILRANNPIILLAKFSDIVQTTIIRNPIDLIPSTVTKTIGGLGSNIVSGLPMPHEYNYINPERLIKEQMHVYANYAYGIEKNIENLIPFTFEQVTQDIKYVVKKLIDIDVNNDEIPELRQKAQEVIQQHNKGEVGFNNATPIDKKPDIYYQIKDMVLNHKDIEKTNKIYNDCKNLILEQQNNWDK